jgi:hypothetical protein
MKKLGYILFGLLVAGVAQAAVITAVDGGSASVSYTNENWSSSELTITIDNWGRSDNFSGTDFSDSKFTISGNQAFLFVNISNSDFSGTTFDWTPYVYSGGERINIFRTTTGSAGADFSDTVWNITLSTGSFNAVGMFDGGAGVTDAANAADALSMAGADFNFLGTDTSLADEIGALLITNLGGFDGETAIGAFYDTAFLNNNATAFGYADADALDTALTTAGWQVIPEPATIGMLGLGAIITLLTRRMQRS